MTHTYAKMGVPREIFEHIKKQLEDVGYDHAIIDDDGEVALDMHGIALVADEPVTLNQQRARHGLPPVPGSGS